MSDYSQQRSGIGRIQVSYWSAGGHYNLCRLIVGLE